VDTRHLKATKGRRLLTPLIPLKTRRSGLPGGSCDLVENLGASGAVEVANRNNCATAVLLVGMSFLLDRNAVQPADPSFVGFRVHTIVRKTERADDSRILAVLSAPALEYHVVELVAADSKRPVRAFVHWAACLPRILADP
jgi:hypothetical protein